VKGDEADITLFPFFNCTF